MLVSNEIADKLKTNTLYNTVALHSPDGSFEDITGESIVLDSFSLENEIVEKELKFGGCIASEMSVKLIDYDCSALIGKTVQVIITATYLESELYPSDDLYPSNTLICPAETGTVWGIPRSLATTGGIIVIFFSCGYLDVSVPRVGLPLGGMAIAGRVAPFGYLRV